jgi:hypothetical protein
MNDFDMFIQCDEFVIDDYNYDFNEEEAEVNEPPIE